MRAAAQWVAERFGLSERRVCRLLALDRNTLRYRSRRRDDADLWTRIREIAETKRRYGCPRIYVRLRREGWQVNHKKWNGCIIATKGSRYSGDDGSRPRRCPESPCRNPRSQDAVMRWTLCMTGWPMADGSSV